MAGKLIMSSRRRILAGFTLIELVICTGIVAMLMALLLGVVSRTHESVRRTTDLSNLRQLTVASISYAELNDGAFPPGRLTTVPPIPDDYTGISYVNCWRPLKSLAPGLDKINSCAGVREGYADASEFGQPGAEYGRPVDTRVGWVYWAGRDDLWAGTTLKYRSLRRLSDRITPGSNTLWTCLCWDSAGSYDKSISVCPHVGTRYVEYQSGVTLAPPPDGLGVALTDGSASFVAWKDLIIVSQSNGYKLYYQP